MKKGFQEFLRESARDSLALGSIVFLILVVARALLGPYLNLVYQLIISSIALLILSFFIKDFEYHLALGFVLIVFTLLFYNYLPYHIFSVIVYIIMIISAMYLGDTKKRIIKGVVLGIISTVVGYLLTNPIINFLNLTI